MHAFEIRFLSCSRKVIAYDDYQMGMSNILKEHYESTRGSFVAANAENEEILKR